MLYCTTDAELMAAITLVRTTARDPRNRVIGRLGEDLQGTEARAPKSGFAQGTEQSLWLPVERLVDHLRIHFMAPGFDTPVQLTYELRDEDVQGKPVTLRVLTIQLDIAGRVSREVVEEQQQAMFAMAMPYCSIFYRRHSNVEPQIHVHHPVLRGDGLTWSTPLMMRFRADHHDTENRILSEIVERPSGRLLGPDGNPVV